jgi:hypothetical protein
VRVFGGSPNESAHEQNIFVRVASWTWISRPMTGSHSLDSRGTGVLTTTPQVRSKARASSSAWAASRMRFSAKAGHREAAGPRAGPPDSPQGRRRPDAARDIGTVK